VFNTVEDLIDHHLLGIHHVNELVPPDEWIYWDLGFIAWGLTMIAAGWWLLRAGGDCAGYRKLATMKESPLAERKVLSTG
jgi:uncharacterized membrane protein